MQYSAKRNLRILKNLDWYTIGAFGGNTKEPDALRVVGSFTTFIE